ncbi:MAG: hypothetical protein AAF696_04310 [Bacteroidota bacterium]
MTPQNLSPKLSWLLFFLAGLLFVWAKWQDLFLPLYWDEIGVYGPGILYMLDNGISMLPSSLDPELSRGHPLFFYALFASWVKLFGYSLFNLHLLSLLISLGLFASVFHMAKEISSPAFSLIVSIWLMIQGVSLAQASLALPEVLLALELLWALYFFYKKRMALFILTASLALLTKESALVLPIACACWYMGNVFIGKISFSLKKTGISFAPLLSYLIFLAIQKQTYGWYFFPYHMELVNLDLGVILEKLGDYIKWSFWDQGRFIYTAFTLSGYIFFLLTKKKTDLSFISLLFLFLLGFLAFSALNVYMDRYVYAIFPILALFTAHILKHVENKYTSIIIGTLLFCATPFSFQTTKGFRFDVDINYREYVQLQKEASTFIEEFIPPNEPFLANWPLYNGFLDPRFGFVKDTNHNKAWVAPNDSMEFRALLVPPDFAKDLPREGDLIKSYKGAHTQIDIYQKKTIKPGE